MDFKTLSTIFGLFFVFALTCIKASHSVDRNVIVKVDNGWLQGEVLQVVTGDAEYFSFKGIPYAEPPIGDLRFMPPQAIKPWKGVRNATQHSSICVQQNIYTKEFIPSSEDCLYLNVYTPNTKPENLLPVMFYIHGGGFQAGSGNVDQLGPDYLIKQNVVLVTINYRLNIFGFLCMDSIAVPGNAGLLDQVEAMKWVQKNIVKFGGDPDNLTIFGQSAGGTSVALHTLSPISKGLFKRAASMSGVPFNDWALPLESRRRAFKVGQKLGLWTHDDTQLLKFLQSTPAETLLNITADLIISESPNVVFKQQFFIPVVEINHGANNFLTIDPIQALKEGKVHFGDYMIGHTNVEGLNNFMNIGEKVQPLYNKYQDLLLPQKILNVKRSPSVTLELSDKIYQYYFGLNPIDLKVAKEFITYISDTSYSYDITAYVRMLPKVGKIYLYQFTAVTDINLYGKNNKYGIVGATHEDDLRYLFYPEGQNITIKKDSIEYSLIERICGLYANFARYGNPTPDNSSILWPDYNNVTQYYMDIGNTLAVGQYLDANILTFWESIFDAAGLPFY